ncbi:MAG TPA: zeta toxin family protein [Allosphingosinicella sp.]
MAPQKADQPVFLIIAGPNGSGKSSSYRDTQIEESGRTIWIVNPDLLTLRIHEVEALGLDEANGAAVRRIEAWLDTSMDVHKSVGVETVLSTPKYRRLVTKAKGLGFLIWLVYVVLDTPARNIERVRMRVRKGGHDVPEEKVRARYTRSLEQLPWFLDQADAAWIYDNSGNEPKRIGEKSDGVVTLDESALAAVVAAVRSIETE